MFPLSPRFTGTFPIHRRVFQQLCIYYQDHPTIKSGVLRSKKILLQNQTQFHPKMLVLGIDETQKIPKIRKCPLAPCWSVQEPRCVVFEACRCTCNRSISDCDINFVCFMICNFCSHKVALAKMAKFFYENHGHAVAHKQVSKAIRCIKRWQHLFQVNTRVTRPQQNRLCFDRLICWCDWLLRLASATLRSTWTHSACRKKNLFCAVLGTTKSAPHIRCTKTQFTSHNSLTSRSQEFEQSYTARVTGAAGDAKLGAHLDNDPPPPQRTHQASAQHTNDVAPPPYTATSQLGEVYSTFHESLLVWTVWWLIWFSFFFCT